MKEFSKDAFRELAKTDVAAARRYAEKLAHPDERKKAEIQIACGIAASDPVSAVARAPRTWQCRSLWRGVEFRGEDRPWSVAAGARDE